jgi:SNF2 family DNA or RNA helicase
MKLRPYQVAGIDYLKKNPCAGLFIDMGLGKTAIALHAFLFFGGPILLVGPIRVIETVWEAEAKKWPATKNLTFSLVRGSKSAREQALKAEADVYLVNPELLPEALEARAYGALVIDESSMFKNPSTKRFKLVRKHLKKFSRRVILTGTPNPNSLMDLWSQIFILDLGQRLDTAFFRFKQRFFMQLDYMGYKFGPRDGATEKVTELISDIIYRVEAEGNLPAREVIENIVPIELPVPVRRIYREMERQAFIDLGKETTITAVNAAAAMMKLRQLASGFIYDDDHSVQPVHREKIDALESILDETGSPVIVVYHFQHELAALQKRFSYGVTLDKGWSQEAWDAKEIPLLFLHPASGGHGLNLQYGSHTMVIYSASFSYEQMAQTRARIDRQGQLAPVIFHFLRAIDTVDDLLLEVLEAKKISQATVLSMVKEYADARRR